MKKITLLMAALTVSFAVVAQAMHGTYNVGTLESSPNFTSLSAAVTAVNTNGIDGDLTLLITSNTTEAADISLGVNTGSNKLTIKPAVGVSPIITFTNTGASVSIDGHFVIGSPNALSTNLVSTNNIIIDGSNTVDGTTKDMTIVGSASTISRGVIRIFGNCDDITIKNCIITGKNTSGSNNGAVHVTNFNASSVNYNPDRLTLENNTLTNVDGNGGAAFHVSNSGTPTVGMTGLKVKNNIINGRVRAMFISYTNDGDIYGNTISEISQTDQGSAAITLQTNFGTAGIFNVYNNKITAISTINKTAGANNGVIGIDNQCVTPKVVNIYNNMLSGFAVGNAATTNTKIYGIRSTATSTCNIFNNTIVLPEMTDMTAFGTSYIGGIVFATAAATEVGPATTGGITTVKNNIIISNETTMKVWAIRRVGTGTNFVSDNNIIYSATSNNYTGYFNNADAATLADWRTASGQDLNSKSVAVNFIDAAAGDLRITGTSLQDGNLAVPRLDAVLNDMFGTVRAATTYAGAHEATLPFMYTTVNNIEQTARIMRTSTGVQVNIDGEAAIELYTINGMLIEKKNVNGTYSKDLNNGMYIIRINGKSTKFIK
ncbi:MAG: T9SS type A sorting domain-containing protein [Paludibacter sp.]